MDKEKELLIGSMSDIAVRNLAAYTDNRIALIEDLQNLSSYGAVRTGIVVITLCLKGKASLYLNGDSYAMYPNDLLICHPNIIVEKSCSKDMTGCDFMIDTCDRDNFYDKLTSMSPEVARDKIRANVSDAFEEFITTNAKDREDIKDILNQAQEKINGAKNDELKESYSIVAKRKITNLKDKPTNILGEVVGKLAKAAVTDEVFKEQYTTNDGHVNMEAVVDASRVIYTFLEMVNTTKMAPMNESHIKDILENMFKK